MFALILKPLSTLSLATIHRLGHIVGLGMYYIMPNLKKVALENMKQSNLFGNPNLIQKALKENIIENGKFVVESLALWNKTEQEKLSYVHPCKGWHIVEAALKKKKGIIFLTPHMGCFEITSLFYGAKNPITVIFRRPKMKWLQKLIQTGRTQNQVRLAPANVQGVRMLIQALNLGEAIGMLPDHIPAKGEGEWAPFFGKPAYTITLASKLANKTGATVIMAFGERLPDGKGFELHLTELDRGAIATPSLLNLALEKQIAQKPIQYLWSYPRYRARKRALTRENRRKGNKV